ncbi:hypothetical protein [Amycolatopsis sp. NPDC059657]|uniref:hypothetical protein n=1 Tax=Amycolatopsis sp. NPDC059657 TaxID=3346899 RepID=UPI00366AA8BC
MRPARVLRRLLPFAVLALPGGHHGGILPGVQVNGSHRWAAVCDACNRVQKTLVARQAGVRCSRCEKPCGLPLPLSRCRADECGRVLVYATVAKSRIRRRCDQGTHHPAPRFTGTLNANGRTYDFAPDGRA